MLKETLGHEAYKELENIAYAKSKPYCYSCNERVHGSHCKTCHSDDNMRLVEGVGCEWGIDWVIEHLISENCAPVDDSVAEDSLRDCYEETVKIGWLEYDVIEAIKELDPISFDIAKSEYIDGLKQDEQIIEIGCEDYWVDDVQGYISSQSLEVA